METTPSFPRPAEAEVDSSPKVRNFLRAILVLSFAGLFVAGALSISKIWNLGLPCGAAHGCDVVNNHPSSRWLGVPVAYIGFFGYVLIGLLAIGRTMVGAAKAKRLALGGYLLSAFGAMTSVALQVYSFAVINATCRWCFASAILMVLLLVFHALEYGERVGDDVPAGASEFPLVTALAIAALAGLGIFGVNLKKATYSATPVSAELVQKAQLVPAGAHIFGDKDSPITIVEFADLMCPVCQQTSPKVKEYVLKHPGKVRLVYRHFPLDMHPMGSLAAAVSEAAADEGKFWDFAVAVMATGENMETPERVFEIASQVGLKPDDVKAKLAKADGPEMSRLTRDINAANALGLHMTPTFLVQVKGLETQAFSYQTMMDELDHGRYSKIIEGK